MPPSCMCGKLTGMVVRLSDDDGRGNFRCTARDERGDERGDKQAGALGSWLMTLFGALGAFSAASTSWTECAPDELALLPEPSRWALTLSLYYPYAIVPEAGEGPVCNY